jgi:hypothetical protein
LAERPTPTTRQASSGGPPPQLLRDPGQPPECSWGYARCLFDAQDLTAQHHALLTTLGMKANRIYVDHGLLALRRRTSILDLTTVLTTTVTTVAVSATPPTRRFGAVLAWLLRLPAPGSAEVASCRSWRVPGKRCHRVVTTRYVHAGTGGDAQGASLQVDDFQGTQRDPANATSRTVNPSAAPGRVIAASTVTSRNTPTHIPSTSEGDVTTSSNIHRSSEPVSAGRIRGSNPLSSTKFEQVRATFQVTSRAT